MSGTRHVSSYAVRWERARTCAATAWQHERKEVISVTFLGENVVPDAGMDDEGVWTITTTDDGVVTFANSVCTLENGPLNGLAQIFDGIPITVIGDWYQLKIKLSAMVNTMRIQFAGEVFDISTPGIKTFRVQATAADSVILLKRNIANMRAEIEWLSIRKEGNNMSSLVMEMRDFDGDKKQFSIEMGVVSDGATYTTISGEATALAAAINAVVAGNNSNLKFIATETEPDDTDASAFLAQAHVRWIIEWKDATTGDGPYQTAIPCPDLGDDTLVLVGSNHYDPANAEWITLIAAMEGGEVVNPRTGNGITIQDIFLEE